MNTASVLPTAPAQYYANCDAAAQSLVAGLRTRLAGGTIPRLSCSSAASSTNSETEKGRKSEQDRSRLNEARGGTGPIDCRRRYQKLHPDAPDGSKATSGAAIDELHCRPLPHSYKRPSDDNVYSYTMPHLTRSGERQLHERDHDVSDWFHAEIVPFRAHRQRAQKRPRRLTRRQHTINLTDTCGT
jgi:hypothetical protein